MNRTRAREGITCLPSCLDLSHIVTLAPVQPCVTVYSAVTRPSGGLVFGAGQGRLDTDWTRPHAGGRVFSARGGAMGDAGPPRIDVRTL